MPKTWENWLGLENSYIYHACQTHEIYQVPLYSVDFKAPRELWKSLSKTVQSTPVISRLLGAKIRKRELSGSPVISRCHAKATTREFRITDPHSQAFTTRKQYDER